MLFNSISYVLFFPVIFIFYWFVFNKSLRWQNILLLISSYFFYSCWDWRFVFLLAFSTFLDYFTGIKIYKEASQNKRRIWLAISVVVNLSFLGFFKYYNFFVESFADFVRLFGLKPHISTLQIILPVGISFYTFHGLSYVFDLYNKKIKPSTDFVEYSLFVSFFPLLVAGPIERATHLLPQVERPRLFKYSNMVDGLRQMLWGFFKKVVIADNCAVYANIIFNNSDGYSGSTLVLGALLFAFQIYGDFSGYSDIAIGTARLLGFELLRNFSFPYFSRDIAEFWRKWHISLSSWFRDYLYIPLGGSKVNTWKKIRNVFIIFLISGFWHGANWTFIVWGGLNALFIMPSILLKTNRNNLDIVALGRILPSLKETIAIIVTFGLVCFAWIFFRAESLEHAFSYILGIVSPDLLSIPFIVHPELKGTALCILMIIPFMIIEWAGREDKYALEKITMPYPTVVRWSFYAFLIFCIGMYAQTEEIAFVYFQF